MYFVSFVLAQTKLTGMQSKQKVSNENIYLCTGFRTTTFRSVGVRLRNFGRAQMMKFFENVIQLSVSKTLDKMTLTYKLSALTRQTANQSVEAI